MFSKNLKYYRLRNHMTKKELARRANVTPMSITNYEKGERKPGMDTIKALAEALNVHVTDFLAVRNENIVFEHGAFRKTLSLSESQQDYIRESVEEYFNRFLTVVEILGGDVLPSAPLCHVLPLQYDVENNAVALRNHLGFACDGPIEDLIGKLENKGILVYECEVDNSHFSGMNGFVNGRPYIVINPLMNAERIRSTIVHELAHLMFNWSDEMDKNKSEYMATAISGAFLLSKTDALRELGIRRSAITMDMSLVAKEYGISMWLLTKRAEQCEIVSASAARAFYIYASGRGWRTSEPSRINKETPSLFNQLVFRAVNEGEISIQRGAELLNVPYDRVLKMCRFAEE